LNSGSEDVWALDVHGDCDLKDSYIAEETYEPLELRSFNRRRQERCWRLRNLSMHLMPQPGAMLADGHHVWECSAQEWICLEFNLTDLIRQQLRIAGEQAQLQAATTSAPIVPSST
jgi:hypothetical protein